MSDSDNDKERRRRVKEDSTFVIVVASVILVLFSVVLLVILVWVFLKVREWRRRIAVGAPPPAQATRSPSVVSFSSVPSLMTDRSGSTDTFSGDVVAPSSSRLSGMTFRSQTSLPNQVNLDP
jgi:hypothetical protein